jgi:hypothetical protein
MPAFIIREGVAPDVAGIMRLKLELAISDGIAYTVRATAADWERDGFGPGCVKTRFSKGRRETFSWVGTS